MKQTLLILLLTFGNVCLFAQFPNVKIFESNAYVGGVCEPSIAVFPGQPQKMAAGSIMDKFYTSQDSGKTWTASRLTSKSGVYGDPCLVADKNGRLYYFHLSDPEGQGWRSEKLLDRIVVQRSNDLGKSWGVDHYIGHNPPKDQDKEWAAINHNNDHIAVSWTEFDKYGSKDSSDKSNILFSYSSDHGQNWSEAMAINEKSGNCLDDDQTPEGAVPTFGPRGEVYVAWSYDEKIYFDRSFDQGKTWLEKDIVVAHHEGGWNFSIPGLGRCNGMPILSCDVSDGPFRGSLYLVWGTLNEDGESDIQFSFSLDKGNTWAPPQTINDDSGKHHQFLPWMAIDPVTGYLYVVFYDRRHYEDQQTDVYLAYSKDAGQTWVNERISESPFVPNENIFFGDYNNVSVYDGVVRPIWTRYEEQKLSIWTALINMK